MVSKKAAVTVRSLDRSFFGHQRLRAPFPPAEPYAPIAIAVFFTVSPRWNTTLNSIAL